MSDLKNTTYFGYLLAFFGGMTLSFDTVLIRAINLPADQIAFWRSASMALPVILILCFSMVKKRPLLSKKDFYRRDFLLACFFYGLSCILFPISAMTTSIANMLFIISTAPLWAAIFSWLVNKELVSRVTGLAFVMAIIGVAIVMFGPNHRLAIRISIGDITALATAMSMAAAFVVGRSSDADLSLSPAIGAMAAACLLFVLFDINFDINLTTWMLILIEGGVVVFFALTLIAKSSALIPPAQLSFFLLLETVFGPIWIWMVFGDIPNTSSLIGGAIILLALTLNSLYAIMQQRKLTNTKEQQVAQLASR